jgi:hypothetical protein
VDVGCVLVLEEVLEFLGGGGVSVGVPTGAGSAAGAFGFCGCV